MNQIAADQEASRLQNSATHSEAESTVEASQDGSAHQAQEVDSDGEWFNPLYLLAAITLGIPAVALIAFIAVNPGVQDGALSTLAMIVVLSAFTVAAIFEIKRLADQP